MIRYHARWVVPVTAPPVADAVVAVERERIAYVGSRESAPPGQDVDLGNVLLMPGLVNTHGHLELTGMRGFLEELDFPLELLVALGGEDYFFQSTSKIGRE